MMILQSELAGDNSLPGMPARMRNGTQRRDKVSRLEFHAVDGARSKSSLGVDAGSDLPATEVLRQEIAALQEQLKMQAQQVATEVETAERKARAASRLEWEEELEERVAIERTRMMRACEAFGKERTAYFRGVEAEVVKLALAIAARVLHREATL
ncbi:MAG: hypothetical protein ABI158_14990, partial [Edaphobacter sp.]